VGERGTIPNRGFNDESYFALKSSKSFHSIVISSSHRLLPSSEVKFYMRLLVRVSLLFLVVSLMLRM